MFFLVLGFCVHPQVKGSDHFYPQGASETHLHVLLFRCVSVTVRICSLGKVFVFVCSLGKCQSGSDLGNTDPYRTRTHFCSGLESTRALHVLSVEGAAEAKSWQGC